MCSPTSSTKRPCNLRGLLIFSTLRTQKNTKKTIIHPYCSTICETNVLQFRKFVARIIGMSYSITPILHTYASKNGLHKVLIQVIHNRLKVYSPTMFKVQANQFANKEVVNHPHRVRINATIRKQMVEIEERLINRISGDNIDLETLRSVIKGEDPKRMLLADFIKAHLDENKNTLTPGTIKAYNTVLRSIETHHPKTELARVDDRWLKAFESKMFSLDLDQNTIHRRMKTILAFLNAAELKSLIDRNQFKAYRVPKVLEKIPEYISEKEMAAFKAVCDATAQPMAKLSGYYFLLSCFAGYRISDLKRFKYEDMVRDGKIILKTKKNGKILSMPIHTRLAEVLDFCKDHPLKLSEQNMRDYVKQLAVLAGINRKIKVHTARHSFAMMLMDSGFDLEETAELLGNTIRAAQVYARISNKRLENKVMEKLG